MKKILLSVAFLLCSFIAFAQVVGDTPVLNPSRNSYAEPRLYCYDARGFVADSYSDVDYALDRLLVTITTSEGKVYKYKAKKGDYSLSVATELAGQEVNLTVEKRGYNTAQTTWTVPTEAIIVPNTKFKGYAATDIFLISETNSPYKSKVKTINLTIKVAENK